jgi:mannitol-1-phosphate/altronate dehydrogenase
LFKDDLTAFHKVLEDRRNNINIRDKRDDIVINSISKARWLIEQIRNIGSKWSESATYNNLDNWQKVWLDEKYKNIRDDDKQNDDYLSKAQSHFANWFIGSYKQTIKDSKLLGNDDIDHIKDLLKQEQELLR